jgi:FAD/FMN-containing dehydrogenase
MEAVRRLLRERHPDRGHPVFFRFVAADDAYLSPFAGRDSMTISVAAWLDSGQDALFDDVHQLLAGFDARGHWGKRYRFGREDVRRLYPGLAEFAEVRAEFDPYDLFLNDHTRMLFS